MSEYVAIRDGGKTNEEGASRLINKLAGTQNEGIVGSSDFNVAEQGTPAMAVDVAVGDVVIEYLDYQFHGWIDAEKAVTITTADGSNPRKDRIVAYIDLSVVSSSSSNNPGALKFAAVAGTPAGSPTEPDDAAVQTAVGAGNPWTELALVDVGTGVTEITDSDITDRRSQFQLGGGVGGCIFALVGDLYVGNDLTPYWIATRPGTFLNIFARVKTAPTGQDAILRVKKNGVQVDTITISAGSTNASKAINEQFDAGDYFSLDVTQIGSSVAGGNATVAVG